jgi:ubiquinone/menaquinone biosynthesis C-methylase UbiE
MVVKAQLRRLSVAAPIEVIVSIDDLTRYDPQATYGAIALEYDYARQYYWAFSTADLLQQAGIEPGMTVLDAACGTGAATVPAAERVRPGGRVVAVDFSPEMLALASEKASRRALLNIDWRLEDVTALDLPPESFDAVLCLFALFSVADMTALAASLWRLVRPGGRLVVVTKGRPFLAPLGDQFFDAAVAEAPDLQPPQPWQRTDTPARLREVLAAAGVAADITSQTATTPLRESADWWRIVCATGLNRTAQLLGPAAAARVEAANLRAITEQGIDALSSTTLCAVAQK